MWVLAKISSIISWVIHRVFSLVEFFLLLRLALKFFGASPKAQAVSLIYKYTYILVAPFDFIFPDIYWSKTHLVEIATISAMIGYALAIFLLFRVLKLFPED